MAFPGIGAGRVGNCREPSGCRARRGRANPEVRVRRRMDARRRRFRSAATVAYVVRAVPDMRARRTEGECQR